MKCPYVVVDDNVTFAKLLQDNHEAWNMSAYEFRITKKFLGKRATVAYVQTHFEDNGTKSYFLDVIFPCGHEMKRVNFLCFELEYH